ncbi:MAG: succinate dehydrogenase cytochrome b subunit [Fibrobacter sp.]|nr:succinate dehydrogenase cytochrome b subunit [Fibrobacter sp.]
MEIVMGLALLLHFYMAITLTLENRKARPQAYAVNKRIGTQSLATFTMIYSGIWILVYLIFHIKNLKLGTYLDLETTKVILAGFQLDFNETIKIRDMFTTTITEFGRPLYATFYVLSMVVLGFHLFHAISSAFQTMGVSHQRWNTIIKYGSMGFSIVISVGFALEAIACFIIGSVVNGRF